MNTNVGKVDRIARVAIGLVLFYFAFFSGSPLLGSALIKYGAIIVGLVMFVTATVRICPLYAIFGIKTCKV